MVPGMVQLNKRTEGVMAITNTKQDWSIGAVVKVGFMQLRVLGVEAINDYLPDIYTLESLDGRRQYEFIPHNGLNRIYGGK
jgi:hypothetical protein